MVEEPTKICVTN